MHHSKSMYVTNVEKEGPFLKIWGQIDKKSSLEVEEALLRASQLFDQGQFIPKENTLEVGLLYCAKYIDAKYYRARITSIAPLNDGMVEVYFMDYGNKDLIPAANLRSLECFNAWFISLPPLSTAFILAEVVCIGGEWNDRIVEQISKEIRYMEHNYVIVAQAIRYYFIRVFVNDIDLGLHLVRQNLMQSTSIQTQEAVLLAMIPRTVPTIPLPNQSLLQYKSFTLEPSSQHEIYVSYITDGPSHFSVQLKKYEGALAQLMREINSIPLKPLDELPIPGTVCLAKCVEDNHICRAVVTSEVDSQFKLFYVDFGNTELVPPENLYQIAFKFVIPKIMAIRLSLAGIEKTSMTLEMQCAFKQFVDNRLLMMEVLPAAKKMTLPKCRMWDPVSNIDVIDVLNQAAQHAYPDLIALHRGFTQLVKVSFVYSCNRFYVQLKSKEAELNQLMKDLQVYGHSNQSCYLDKAKVGQPCCALFSFDQNWYRCLVTEVEGNRAKIRYIDFGNEEFVPIESLKVVNGEYLTILRPQAIECCLNGYQNMAEDQERDLKLEELILEQEFTMKVIDSIGDKTLIDLMDASNTTVTALLLESIMAQSKVQNIVSISETTKTEGSAKRFGSGEEWRSNDDRNTKQYFQHDDRRSPRGQNWKEKTSDNNTSWKQSSRRRSDSNSNESTGSWRQDNRGFKNRKENDWNDRGSSINNSFKDRGFRNRPDNFENEKHIRSRNQNETGFGSESRNVGRSSRNSNGEWTESNSRGDRPWKDNNQAFNKKHDRENKERGKTDYDDFKGRNKNENKTVKGGWNDKTENGEWNNQTEGVDWNNKCEKSNRINNSATNDWNNKSSRGGGDWNERKPHKDRSNDWNSKGGSDHKFGDRRDNDRGDFKKKSFRREGNEQSSSGSEKSFGKGPRTYSRNGNRPPRSDRQVETKSPSNSWDNNPLAVVVDNAPSDAKFKTIDVSERQEKVTISWFHNPCSFFCQLIETQESFKQLMEEIQQAYKDRPSGSGIRGAPVVALFPEDNVLYRATIMDVLGSQYKVHYVDFGNVSVVDKIWPIENKFMNLPMQAIPCGLNALEPVGDNWPNPDNYSEYFEREVLNCVFSSCDENGRYWVNIMVDNEDITQQLVKNALAKYTEPVTANVENALLVSQQFRAMLQQVNSCADFTMMLQSGFSINCSMHNLATATEINEDFLRQQLQQILIVYVDDLVEERLQVTLYDPTGTKLNIIEPDEGAYDTVELPCPYLVISSTLRGFVSHADGSTVVIQPSECSDSIEYLLQHLYEYYENLPPTDNPIVPEEGSVYAVKSNDNNWYRGKVTTFNDNKVEVTYLDYGNSEEVDFTRLRDLNPEDLQWDTMAILLTVNVPAADFLEQDVISTIYYGESGWEGELQLDVASEQPLSSESQPAVEEAIESNLSSLQINETSIVDIDHTTPEIVKSQVEECIDICQPPEVAASSIVEKENACPVGGTPAVLSHVDSPSDFYIQLKDSLSHIDELQIRLQDAVGEMTQLESASVGGLCAAPYTIDQQWYRSQILDADDDITTVRFIDYGNTDVIDNNTTQLKTLPADLLTLEEYATRCSLKIKSLEEEWSKAAVERFQSLTAVDNLSVKFIDQDEKTNYVELYSDSINVKDVLVAENLALLENVVLEGKLTGFVSHINSPSEFWVQLESCCVELEWIAEQLSNAGSFQDLEDLTPGSLCAAMFQDDEMWYRARILSNTVAGLEVLFLDYGNSCVCSNLKQLPEHLVMAPPLAQKCSLQKPEGVTSWSPESSQKFSELSADGQTIFTVRKITTGETSIVELLMNDEDVSSKLLTCNTNVDESDSTGISVEEAVGVEDEERLESNQEDCVVATKEEIKITSDIEEEEVADIEYKESLENNQTKESNRETYVVDAVAEKKVVKLKTETDQNVLTSNQLENNESKEVEKSDSNLEEMPLLVCKESSSKKLEEKENKGDPQQDIEYLSENTVRLYLDENKINNKLKELLSPILKEKTPNSVSVIATIELIEEDEQHHEKLIENSVEHIGNTTDNSGTSRLEYKNTAVDLENEDVESIQCSSHDNTIQMVEALVENIVNGVHSNSSEDKENSSEVNSIEDETYGYSMTIENTQYDHHIDQEICEDHIGRSETNPNAQNIPFQSSENLIGYVDKSANVNFSDQEETLETESKATDEILNKRTSSEVELVIVKNERNESVLQETSEKLVLECPSRGIEMADLHYVTNQDIHDSIIGKNDIINANEESKIDSDSSQAANQMLTKESLDDITQQKETKTDTYVSPQQIDSIKQTAKINDTENVSTMKIDVTKVLMLSEDNCTKVNDGNDVPDVHILKKGDQRKPIDGEYEEQCSQQYIEKQENIACPEVTSEFQEMKENHPIIEDDQILLKNSKSTVSSEVSMSDTNKHEIEESQSSIGDNTSETSNRTLQDSIENSPRNSPRFIDEEKCKKIEFVDTILTSFYSPTISERSDVAIKLSPTKIIPKSQTDLVEKVKENISEEI